MDTELDDPVHIANQFLNGKNFQRRILVDMVRGLLALMENKAAVPLFVQTSQPASATEIPIPAGPTIKPPVAVQPGIAGSVFLGPEANRYYTRKEAMALASAIARATAAKT